MPVDFTMTATSPMTEQDLLAADRFRQFLSRLTRSESSGGPGLPVDTAIAVEVRRAAEESYGGPLIRATADFLRSEGRDPRGEEIKKRLGRPTSGMMRSLNAYFKRTGAAAFISNVYHADSSTPLYIMGPTYVEAAVALLKEDGTLA